MCESSAVQKSIHTSSKGAVVTMERSGALFRLRCFTQHISLTVGHVFLDILLHRFPVKPLSREPQCALLTLMTSIIMNSLQHKASQRHRYDILEYFLLYTLGALRHDTESLTAW
jgi:hypothetical protein